jgi:hypothetical protein
MKQGLGSADYAVVGRPVEAVRMPFEFIPAPIRAWYGLKKRLTEA